MDLTVGFWYPAEEWGFSPSATRP